MPETVFQYEVRDSSGNALSGSLEGETPQVVAQQLRDQGYTVIRIQEQAPAKAARPAQRHQRARISHAVYAQFYRELATCIGSGMTIIQALNTLESTTGNPALRSALRGMLPNIERGQRLSENMRHFPAVFSALAVAIIAAGEESGRLEEMLGVLADYAEHDLELSRMLRRETFYPKILLLALCTIVPIGLLIANAINPGMFGFGALIPIGILVATGGLIAIGYYLVKAYRGSAQGRLAVDRTKLAIPIFGKVSQQIAMSRFCRALASLYSAGVGLPEAMTRAAEATDNAALEQVIKAGIPEVQAGGKLSDVLSRSRLIPSLVLSMLRTGEQTGNLDQTLNKVADYYDDETKTKIHQLGTTIVPICVILAAIVVAVIMAYFYLSYAAGILSAGEGI